MLCHYLVCLVYVFQFQETLEHAKKLGGFSVTMDNVSKNLTYVILMMTVEIIAMNRGQMVLFVVSVLDCIMISPRILCAGNFIRQFLLKITFLGYFFKYDFLLRIISYGVLGKIVTNSKIKSLNLSKSISKLGKGFNKSSY